jgi:O-antigen/teichoic acid export membrane protein
MSGNAASTSRRFPRDWWTIPLSAQPLARSIDALRLELGKLGSSSLARNAGWMVLGQGSGFLLQAAYFILIARLLGPAEYGLFAGVFALTGILGQYSSAGSGTLFLRYVTAETTKFSLYWGNILAVTMVFGIVMIGGLSIFAGELFRPGAGAITVLAAVANCLCAQLTTSAAKVFQTYEQMGATAGLNLAANCARTLAAFVMLITIHHATAYQWSMVTAILSILAAAGAVALVTLRFGRPAFSLDLIRTHLWEGFGFAFATSTSTAYNDIDKTMLSHYGMNAANGVYSMAYRVIDVATIPGLAIREAAMPRFFRAGAIGICESSALSNRLMKRAVPLGLAAGAVVFLSAPLLPRLVGHGFGDTVFAMRWLCAIPLFRAFHHMTGSALTGSGRQRYRTLSQGIAVCLNIGLNIWLIPRHGWLGAAWSSLLTDGLLALMNGVALAWLCRQGTREAIPLAA